MTKLNKPVRRETPTLYQNREIILTVAPSGGSQTETRIGVRLKGRRCSYTVGLSRLFVEMASWHGAKEKAAKRAARAQGVAWKQAKKQFNKENAI